METVVGGVGREPVEVARYRADVLGDRPFVVVENDDEALGRADDVVERLHGEAAGEGGIAADGDDVLAGAAQVAGRRHAEGGAEGGAGMACAKRVVLALSAIEETAGAAGLAEVAEKLALATGQQLVRVALVGDVEGELVLRRLKNAVERDGQLDHAKVGADVTAMVGGDRDDLVANLLRQLRQDSRGQGFQIFRAADAIEQARGCRWLGSGDGRAHRTGLSPRARFRLRLSRGQRRQRRRRRFAFSGARSSSRRP
ncbi:MAG: hypothetical protein BWX86_02648 [Verrucomicrobia bacterium ADurb.Bin122]|nr:MAG: hypothetical protein BWX86_02648 [Verrucomicrobia bacterium ADurb.Bin122]